MTVTAARETSTATSDVIRLAALRFAWPGRRSFSLAIDGFGLPATKRMLLIGPSGSGKSTFLSLLCGIVAPMSGTIHILDTDITGLSSAARDAFRAEHIGIIFQMFNLLPYGTVIDNVLLPLNFAPLRRKRVTAKGDAQDEALRLLTRLGLEPHLMRGAAAANLSVGQQQRVAAARALIGNPEIVVADEPTSALDRDRQAAFLDLLFTEVAKAGATLIMVSHDESLAPRFDRVVRLDEITRSSGDSSP
jgi:putative ABC transport system ATP-binding protein